MAVFKCKMCGGALEINNNESVVTCEYCGTQQTLPKLDDDRRANLYDRANHFRRNNEFDKAMGIYEQILNEDSTDAEAYWSLVLCRYGIEYVEDPASHKRVPTINRAQFTSIFDDDNYKSALNNADAGQKAIYEKEAKAINEIQKGILAISQKEEPFDVFICYKETDNNGRRTPDSVLAQDLYYQLKQEGFKVFFARITLEDKLGSAYEPYIFAALNSAKVMVVLGTKPEYFNAVWVKNEWSRYLSLIKQGQKKILIPAYKDMDPYDLPEEFSHLQAQDMSKLGFMQDLIRGIKKIAQADAPKPTVVKETIVADGSANTAPLLKRAFMFLEDGDWDAADEYCEKVLDIDPECAEAYLGQLMAELEVKKQENLKDCLAPFDKNNSYQKVMRFADDTLKAALTGYLEIIVQRVENTRLENIYQKARKAMQEMTREAVEDAIRKFRFIINYKDSAEQLAACEKRLAELKEEEETRRLERERQAEIARQEAERIAKRNKKIAIIIASIVCAIIAFIIVLTTVIIPSVKYNNAIALLNAGNYSEAVTAFEELGDYKDSADYLSKFVFFYDKVVKISGTNRYAYNYTYDSSGNVTKEKMVPTYGDITTTKYTYDSNENLTRKEVNYSSGKITTYEYTYDSQGNMTAEVTTNASGDISSKGYSYDSNGNLAAEVTISASGFVSTYEYTYEYDSSGNITKEIMTDEDGDITTTEYIYYSDGNLYRKELEYDSGSTRSYTYDSKGNLTTTYYYSSGYSNRYSTLTKYTYDSRGNLIKEEFEQNVYTGEGNDYTSTITYSYNGEHILYKP